MLFLFVILVGYIFKTNKYKQTYLLRIDNATVNRNIIFSAFIVDFKSSYKNYRLCPLAIRTHYQEPKESSPNGVIISLVSKLISKSVKRLVGHVCRNNKLFMFENRKKHLSADIGNQ